MRALTGTAWKVTRPAVLGLTLVFAPAVALAASADEPLPAAACGAAQEHAEEPDDREHGEDPHGHHANGLSLFLGNTWERVDGGKTTERGFTFGVEYFHRLTPSFSLGGIAERAGGDIRGTLLIAQAYYRLVGGLFLVGGPGVEFRDAHSEEPAQHGALAATSGAPTHERDTTVFLMRVGALYEFEFDRWFIAPTVAIDFVGRDEALVLGVGAGYVF